MSFAAELIEQGDYEEAVAAATTTIDAGQASAETFLERATAGELLERYDVAIGDFEQALARNANERILDQDDVDDRYFSALVAAGQALAGQGKVAEADLTVARYDAAMRALEKAPRHTPRHLKDAADWRARFRGELASLLDKTVETN